MDLGNALVLSGLGVGVVAALLGALTSVAYERLAAIGIGLGLLFWGIEAIVIFREPDNPDLGETGWTMVVGVLAGIYVAAWLAGAAVGRAFRLRRPSRP